MPGRKGDVKEKGRLAPALLFPCLVQATRAWSVGQLAPQPDLTRQCAFDLRSRLGILSIRSDGAARIYNAIRPEKVLA